MPLPLHGIGGATGGKRVITLPQEDFSPAPPLFQRYRPWQYLIKKNEKFWTKFLGLCAISNTGKLDSFDLDFYSSVSCSMLPLMLPSINSKEYFYNPIFRFLFIWNKKIDTVKSYHYDFLAANIISDIPIIFYFLPYFVRLYYDILFVLFWKH